MDLTELKVRGQELIDGEKRARWSISALQELCNHPVAHILNTPEKTTCRRCKLILWPHSSYWQNLVTISPEDSVDIGSAIERFEREQVEFKAKIEAFQRKCLHPEEERLASGHVPGKFLCGVCDLSLDRVLEQRGQAEAQD